MVQETDLLSALLEKRKQPIARSTVYNVIAKMGIGTRGYQTTNGPIPGYVD